MVSLSVWKRRGDGEEQHKGHRGTESATTSVPKLSGQDMESRQESPSAQKEEPRDRPVRVLSWDSQILICTVSRPCLIRIATTQQLVKAWAQVPTQKVVENGSAPKGEEMLGDTKERGTPRRRSSPRADWSQGKSITEGQ